MTEALEDGGQVILLLNRRGFHTFILCPQCGHVVKCDACDLALTYHKGRQRPALPHLRRRARAAGVVPVVPATAGCTTAASAPSSWSARSATPFPDHVVAPDGLRHDADARQPRAGALRRSRTGEVHILLGTQMIAKGLDFPNVTLVGVVNADTALHLPDFRAAERTFQLVAQVAGRTGRGDRPGRVLVQTYSPEHPAIALRRAARLPRVRRRRAAPPSRPRRAAVRPPGPPDRAGADEPAVQAFLNEVARALDRRGPRLACACSAPRRRRW